MDDNQISLKNIHKTFGSVRALRNVSITTDPGNIHCILGDNGAGKSSLVNIISGVFQPDEGEYHINGEQVEFYRPRQAIRAGISTVYQDLAIIPIMSIYRNFFLGNEPIKNNFLRIIDKGLAIDTTFRELERFGISCNDVRRPAGTLSGGERQCVAIARALYFGAKVLILDEPTSALGVKESAKVLEQISLLKTKGINVILISHNIEQSFQVGDKFFIF